jgi:hypothetical protein
MNEKDLIAKIQKFRDIKPSHDWVIFTKEQILGRELNSKREKNWLQYINFRQIAELFSARRFAFAYLSIATIFIGILGVFNFSQNALPGDSLYSLKKITEKGQGIFVSEKDQARYDLKMVGKRLDDLTKIAEFNKIKNIASAIEEIQKSEERAISSLNVVEIQNNSEEVEGIVAQVKELEEKKQRLEQVYGFVGLEEIKETNSTKAMAERLIKDLENKALTEMEEQDLLEAMKYYEKGNFSKTVEILYFISQ